MFVYRMAGLRTVSLAILWSIAAVAAICCTAYGANTMRKSDFVPIEKAQVQTKNGVPRLLLNRSPVLPLVFFPNTDVQGEKAQQYLKEQVKLARDSGVHIYSFPFRVEDGEKPGQPDYSRSERDMQTIVDIDPQAVFLPRLYPGPVYPQKRWPDFPKDQRSLFADGSTNFISAASPYFREHAAEDLVQIVRHLEQGKFGQRIIGYHPGGPESEMFMDCYRERGPDYSKANQNAFRLWLRKHYGSDSKLQQAWGRADVTLDNAAVPTFVPGRFPMHGTDKGEVADMFYRVPNEQDWIDYGFYCSDLSSDTIVEWAKLIKAQTKWKKLTAFFYGYTFELIGSFGGHCRLDKVLACKDVDILAGPISYSERIGGQPGAFMCPVDSITAHGKLWFNENDIRTSIIDRIRPEPGTFESSIQALDMNESRGILERDFAALLAHRTGTWWMDLMGAGAFDDNNIWRTMKERRHLLWQICKNPTPYRPEVGMIVDERARAVVKSDADGSYWPMISLRNEIMKAGASVGFYTLSDFIGGVVPQCKVYVFANCYTLAPEQKERIISRLDKENATAIWFYAPGCFGSDGIDVKCAEKVTGMHLAISDGEQGSLGLGCLKGLNWGWNAYVMPRTVITEQNARVIGRYKSDNLMSAAEKLTGHYKAIMFCGLSTNSDVLRKLFEKAGVHIWTSGNEIVETDGRFLAIHSGPGGLVRVSLPDNTRSEIICGTIVSRDDGSVTLRLNKNETAWLELRGNGIEAPY